MGNLTLNGATSGSITLAPTAVAGTNTLTLPAATGTLIYGTQPSGTIVGTTDTQTLTNKTLTSPTIGGTPVMNASVITSGTAQNSTSGTAITFTGIPSWVKRVTVMLNGFSTNGSNYPLIQLGSGSVQTTGYNTAGANLQPGSVNNTSSTAGFIIFQNSASYVTYGSIIFTLFGSNTWFGSGCFIASNVTLPVAGGVSLSGALDRVNITTVGGTDTFDAGSINILYE